jgi:hypothetical protein
MSARWRDDLREKCTKASISVDEFGREHVATIAGGSWKGSRKRSARTLMRSQRAECFLADRGVETRASRQQRARKTA